MNWRLPLEPLAALYGAVVEAKNAGFASGKYVPQRLGWPVVSIGNLSVGGTGKTPFTAELARLLAARGLHVDVLSRGYGRRSKQVERVQAGGDAERFGDEPLLLARAGVPVFVGASRYAAGLLAEREARGGVHLLDDGLQHRQLARSVDIVLLHPRDAGDRLVPVGRLREPLASLRRAHFLVLREDDGSSEALLRGAGLQQPLWRVRRSLDVAGIAGPVVAFAAIAHPDDFFCNLREHGLVVQASFGFRDHHRFSSREIAALARAAQGATLVTTEKDFVRLPPAALRVLGHVLPVPLRTSLLDEDACMAALLTRLPD